jgi:hypothetical protein
MKMKNYSIYAHALHSRLQLIRNKLDYSLNMKPSQVVIKNLLYFKKAAESIENQHIYVCDRGDYFDAAELLLLSLDPEERKILNQPLWKRNEDLGSLET